MEYIALYTLFKLNDIKYMFDNAYGFLVVFGLLATVYIAIKYNGPDEDGSYYPFASCKTDAKNFNRTIKKACRTATIIFIISLGCNITSGLLPSTGQMVTIITAGKGLKSDTFKVLSELDPMMAQYLKEEARKVLTPMVPQPVVEATSTK